MLQQLNDFLAKEKKGKMSWWVDLGYPPFAPGKCGFPRTGQVIKYYREQAKDDTGKVWTQQALAARLGITDKAVRDIENRDAGIDFDRRQFLSDLFDIPPLLLGIVTLDEIDQLVKERQGSEPVISAPSTPSRHKATVDTEEYKARLALCWQTDYSHSAHIARANMLFRINALFGELPRIKGPERPRFYELLCDYHQFVGHLYRDQQNYDMAIGYLDRARFFADLLNNDELRATCLLRRGHTLNDADRFDESAQAFEEAIRLEKNLPHFLSGSLLLYSGPVYARAARSDKEKQKAAIKLLDRGGGMVRTNQENPSTVDFSLDRYHLSRGAALIAIDANKDAINELGEVAYGSLHPRGQGYNDILQAQAYLNRGMYEMAASYAEAGLVVVQDSNSEVNIARVVKIYQQLRKSPYKNKDDVARLERLLWPK